MFSRFSSTATAAAEHVASALLPAEPIVHGHAGTRTTINSHIWIVGAALAAFTLKLAIAWNTFGTNDVIAFYRFAVSLDQHGLEWTYMHQIAFNHPPLVAYFLLAIYKLSEIPLLQENGIGFPFLLRLPGIIADLLTIVAFLLIRRQVERKIPLWAIALFALSPVSLMVSGFHGNTDPIMVMFLAVAALMSMRDRPMLSGLFFALSCQIKIVPALFFPIFFFYWYQRRRAVAFLAPMCIASVILWSEPLLHFPMVFAKNVLSYGSFWGLWGITYWLRLTGWWQFSKVTYYNFTPAESAVGITLKLLIIASVLLIAWRRRALSSSDLLRSIGYAWVVFFILSPGVCAQYLVWLMPFVLFISPRFFAWLTATSSLFLFFFYNTIADKFPWYLAISRSRNNIDWTPWTIWPWATLLIAMILLWKKAAAADPSLRLFSLRTLPADISES